MKQKKGTSPIFKLIGIIILIIVLAVLLIIPQEVAQQMKKVGTLFDSIIPPNETTIKISTDCYTQKLQELPGNEAKKLIEETKIQQANWSICKETKATSSCKLSYTTNGKQHTYIKTGQQLYKEPGNLCNTFLTQYTDEAEEANNYYDIFNGQQNVPERVWKMRAEQQGLGENYPTNQEFEKHYMTDQLVIIAEKEKTITHILTWTSGYWALHNLEKDTTEEGTNDILVLQEFYDETKDTHDISYTILPNHDGTYKGTTRITDKKEEIEIYHSNNKQNYESIETIIGHKKLGLFQEIIQRSEPKELNNQEELQKLLTWIYNFKETQQTKYNKLLQEQTRNIEEYYNNNEEFTKEGYQLKAKKEINYQEPELLLQKNGETIAGYDFKLQYHSYSFLEHYCQETYSQETLPKTPFILVIPQQGRWEEPTKEDYYKISPSLPQKAKKILEFLQTRC